MDSGFVQTLAVNEQFGPTFQGEGFSMGMPCYFLRLSGCNQHCIWCDTPYTWRFSSQWPHNGNKVYNKMDETHMRNTQDIYDDLIARAEKSNIRALVISGGEPMLQQKALSPLISALWEANWKIEVETAGTIIPNLDLKGVPRVSQYNVSLKLPNSNNPRALSIVPDAIRGYKSMNSYWKFVVMNLDDLFEINELVRQHSLPRHRVYIMPEGITAETLGSRLQDAAIVGEIIKRGYNLTTRLQILTYGNQRGK